MAPAKSKIVTLYLTDWQIRMIRDIYGVECHVWDAEFGSKVVLYGVFPPQMPDVPRMYLTEWQIQTIKDEVGAACHFIELPKKPLVKYSVPVVKYSVPVVKYAVPNVKYRVPVVKDIIKK